MEFKLAENVHQFAWMDGKVVIVLEDSKVLAPVVTPDGKIGTIVLEKEEKVAACK
jgi:hypothetical protein